MKTLYRAMSFLLCGLICVLGTGCTTVEAIVQGSMERLVSILMAAMCAALGLIPLAMSAGEPGSELLAPLAVVVLGGLIRPTALNLIVVPAGYSLIFGHRVRDGTPGKASRFLNRIRPGLSTGKTRSSDEDKSSGSGPDTMAT